MVALAGHEMDGSFETFTGTAEKEIMEGERMSAGRREESPGKFPRRQEGCRLCRCSNVLQKASPIKTYMPVPSRVKAISRRV